MLHILLTILKIIGIILAVILSLILLMLMSILFVPIRYRVNGAKTEVSIDGKARISWLFGAVGLNLFLENKDFSYEIKIFGISLECIQAFIRKLTSKRAVSKKTEKNEKVNRETAEEGDVKIEDIKKAAAEYTVDSTDIKDEKKSVFQSVGQVIKKICGKTYSVINSILHFPGKVIKRVKKIHLTIHSLCDKIKYWINFLKEETTKEAMSLVKEQLIRVLKHILPKKLKGNVIFGFDDPAVTGQVLGGICAFYPLYHKQINISPDFTQNILLGDIDMKGRIYVVFLIKTALKVYFDKNVQHVMKTMKK